MAKWSIDKDGATPIKTHPALDFSGLEGRTGAGRSFHRGLDFSTLSEFLVGKVLR